MPIAALLLGLFYFAAPGRPAQASVVSAAFSRDPEGARAGARAEAPDPPFVRSPAAVSERDAALLVNGGYRFNEQGRLFSPQGEGLTESEFAYALEDARSRSRLKALLEINIILSRNNFSKKLPSEDLASLRKVGSENWDLFSKSTRKDLRRYFTDTEVFLMNEKLAKSGARVPPPYEMQKPWDPGAPAPRGLDSGGTEPYWSGIPLSSMPEALVPLALARPSEAAAMLAPMKAPTATPPPAAGAPPSAPAPPKVIALPVPWKEAPPEAEAKPEPKKFSAETPAPPPVTAVQGLDDSLARIKPNVWELKSPALVQTDLGVVSKAPPPPPLLSLPGQPSAAYPDFNPAGFKAFLESSPYGRDVKPLLALLGDYARDPERRVALGLVQLQYPHLVLDSQKSGAKMGALLQVAEQGRAQGRPGVVLNDGPVIIEVRRLFSRRAFILPDSPDFYRERALPLPTLQAMSREAASEADKPGDWGTLRPYRDGSTRLRSSPEQLAGLLLRELLLLDSKLRGWDADPFHSVLRAEAAQFQFYSDLAEKTGKAPELDADTAARAKAWQERPEEFVDLAIQTLSAPRGGLFESRGPVATARDEVAVLLEADVIDGDTARRTMESLPPGPSEEAALSDWLKSASSTPAQAAWLALEKQARRAP